MILPNQKLLIDYASHQAAVFACKNWHYSKSLPAGKKVVIGIWEYKKYIGCIIFSYGANNNAPKYFNLNQIDVAELTRISLKKHETPVSKILSIAIKLFKKKCPKTKLIFSYADKTNQNHHGGVYQAQGWSYLGERTSSKDSYYIILGKKIHGRSARAKYGSSSKFPKNWSHVSDQTKHLYVKILDKNYNLTHSIFKYPKRAESKDNVAIGFQPVEDGVSPISALQNKEVL